MEELTQIGWPFLLIHYCFLPCMPPTLRLFLMLPMDYSMNTSSSQEQCRGSSSQSTIEQDFPVNYAHPLLEAFQAKAPKWDIDHCSRYHCHDLPCPMKRSRNNKLLLKRL